MVNISRHEVETICFSTVLDVGTTLIYDIGTVNTDYTDFYITDIIIQNQEASTVNVEIFGSVSTSGKLYYNATSFETITTNRTIPYKISVQGSTGHKRPLFASCDGAGRGANLEVYGWVEK